MFSVIMPAYNAEGFIDTALKSVLLQKYGDFELIVVDDGSKDNTKEKILKHKDERIKYIRQENSGVSAARNRGILESRGEFVCFLDSDDEWRPDHLETLCFLIERYGDCGMFLTGYDLRLNNGKLIHKSEQTLRGISDEHFTSNNGFDVLIKNGYFFNTNSVCCRKEVFDKVGLFETGVRNGEDDDMWYRIFTYYPIAVSKKSTTVYDRSNCGATANRQEVSAPFFMSRVEGILKSSDVPQERKESILLWVERNKLSRVRQYILFGKKLKALKLLRSVSFKKSDKKKYLEALICMLIPSVLIRKHIDRRDEGYYN